MKAHERSVRRRLPVLNKAAQRKKQAELCEDEGTDLHAGIWAGGAK